MDDERLLKPSITWALTKKLPIGLITSVGTGGLGRWQHASVKRANLKVASQMMDPNERGTTLLQNWLSYRPTDAYLQAGREVLISLSEKANWDEVSLNTINDIVGFSWDVAKAAGGLFGLGSVDNNEKEASFHNPAPTRESRGRTGRPIQPSIR